MPVQETQECKNCGRSFDKEEEKCPKCNMYVGEDVEEFNKFIDSEED